MSAMSSSKKCKYGAVDGCGPRCMLWSRRWWDHAGVVHRTGAPWDRSWCRYAAAECGREPTWLSRHARWRACVTNRDQLPSDAKNWVVNWDTNLPSSNDLGRSLYGSSGTVPGKSSGLGGVLDCTARPTCQARPGAGAGPGGTVVSGVVAMGGDCEGRC